MHPLKRLYYKLPVTCKDTGEYCRNYQEYLNSEHWRLLRDRFFKSKYFRSKTICGGIEGKCICCKVPGKSLELHHLTYRRLGRERIWDLIPLCRDCHQRTHEVIDQLTKEGKTNILRAKSWKTVKKENKWKNSK